jgi:hypothetical protein
MDSWSRFCRNLFSSMYFHRKLPRKRACDTLPGMRHKRLESQRSRPSSRRATWLHKRTFVSTRDSLFIRRNILFYAGTSEQSRGNLNGDQMIDAALPSYPAQCLAGPRETTPLRKSTRRTPGPLEQPKSSRWLRSPRLCFRPTSPSSFLCNALTLFRCERLHPRLPTSSSQGHCARIFVLPF